MFQFPSLPSSWLCIHHAMTAHYCSRIPPFGHPRVRIFAPDRGLSQLVTSFFGSQCQGIHPVLFLLNRSDSRLAWRVQASWFSSSYTFATFVARCLPIQRFVISYKTFLGIQFLWCITDRNQRVEMRGFEPLTPCLQGRCSPN